MTRESIDQAEYGLVFPFEAEFDAWVAERERLSASIRVQVNRDRFLFDQDDENDEFSPFNTSNS